MNNLMEKIIALAKRRGFFFVGSELYGGLANTYDYGPMGAELLRNIKNLWWQVFVTKRADIVGIDASLISHAKIWEASGHTVGFADAMVDCKNCKFRMRADHLIENYLEKLDDNKITQFVKTYNSSDFDLHELENLKSKIKDYLKTRKVEGLSLKEFDNLVIFFDINCPICGSTPSKDNNWTMARKFNLLFPVQLGIIEGDQSLAYLRGETAQGMFVNFRNVIDSTRVRLPFGIAQLGKSFRNEITPGQSVFRTLEFEQGEIEYFFDPDTTKWELLFEDWKKQMQDFVCKQLGIRSANLRFRAHTDEERSFYSKRTEDLEYQFPFGFKELWGLAYRTNYDLSQHEKFSQRELQIADPQTNKKIRPHVIEPAVGINRLMLMVLCDSYKQDEKRTWLSLNPKLAPVKAAVFPLLANKPELIRLAKDVHRNLQENIDGKIAWDDRGNIGKRYLSQDEIGTPYCITVDFQTLDDKTVTIRDRDSLQQIRLSAEKISEYIKNKLEQI